VVVEEVVVVSVVMPVCVVVTVSCDVKSTLTFAPVSVTVLVTGPNPELDAVTVMVPEVPIGMA
jgi:hypothetical protein